MIKYKTPVSIGKLTVSFALTIGTFYFVSCSKIVEIPQPETQISRQTVFESPSTANAAMLGTFVQLRNESFSFNTSIALGLSADEFKSFFSADDPYFNFYSNSLQSQNYNLGMFWNVPYKFIYQSNAVIEGVQNSRGISPDVGNQLIGEAKFIRAFSYFYLVNVFGRIPLVLTTNYNDGRAQPRSETKFIYDTIISDLTDAKRLLNEKFVGADGFTKTTERTRPTSSAASALLARVYLYSGSYQKAIDEATTVIGNSNFVLLDSLNQVFLRNSKEAIWQLESNKTTYRPIEAANFVITTDPPYRVSLSPQLVSSFVAGDRRWTSWVGSFHGASETYYYPSKYRSSSSSTGPATEYSMMLRLAEVYLIRSEAQVQLGRFDEAALDLSAIRKRAGLPAYNGPMEKTAFLDSILHERQLEFFSEWGHRWLDLKRTGKVNQIMALVTPLKGGTWDPNWALYPIPLSDLLAAPQLQPNNPGY